MTESIDCVRRAKGEDSFEVLFKMLHSYLVRQVSEGTEEGSSKHQPLFDLYSALGYYSQAAKTAILIAASEQQLGSYQAAHTILREIYQKLMAENIVLPLKLQLNLALLHSYLLARRLSTKEVNDSLGAARLLVRVCASASLFPSHVVSLLTSAVIMCTKGGLKKSAFQFGAMLMRAEYKSQLSEKFKPKIMKLVRRPCEEVALMSSQLIGHLHNPS